MSMMELEKPVGPVRNRNLDLIKLISCVAVVVLHCLYTPQFESSRLIYQLCAFAVPCFFMASGYVLLEKRTVSWGYVCRKLMGILRIVLVWNIIIYSVDLLKLMITQGVGQVDYAGQLLRYVKYTIKSMFQGGRLWQFWYLGTTGLLYLMLPVLTGCLRPDRVRGRWICWGGLLAFSVILQTASMVLGRPVQSAVNQTLRLWTALQYFLLGGLMPVIVRWCAQRISRKHHLLLAGVLTVATLAWRLLADHLWIHGVLVEYYYDDLFTVLWIAVGVSALMRVELSPRVVAFVGRLTPMIMGVYIIHVPIRNLIRDNFQISGSLMRSVYAAAVCLIAFLCTYVIRKLPFGKRLTEI